MKLHFCIAVTLAFIGGCSDQASEPLGSLAELERIRAAAIETGQLVGDVDRSSVSVSFVAILADPAAYQNQRVLTYGVLLVRPGDSADSGAINLFLSKEQMEHFILLNSFSLTLSPPYSVNDLVRMNGKYVIVEGLVDPEATGHMGVSAAGLIDVNRIEVIGAEK